MSSPLPKSEMLQTLRTLLGDVFRLRNQGAAYAKIARAQGYIDGYMRMLMDAKVVDQRELLQLIAAERCSVDGPATTDVESDVHIVAA
jgi:DNA-binding FrmR family transcriptional regulator